jgi:hypothetical protein
MTKIGEELHLPKIVILPLAQVDRTTIDIKWSTSGLYNHLNHFEVDVLISSIRQRGWFIRRQKIWPPEIIGAIVHVKLDLDQTIPILQECYHVHWPPFVAI